MKRKLISYDAFEQIQKDSLSNAQTELMEAENALTRILERGPLSLSCFGESNVLYETDKGTFIRASYDIDKNHVSFDGIEEIVIDESSHGQAIKGIISEMLDSILEENEEVAEDNFDRYLSEAGLKLKMRKTHRMGSGRRKRTATEKLKNNSVQNEEVQITVASPSKNIKKSLAAKKGAKERGRKAAQTRKKHRAQEKQRHRSSEWIQGKRKVDAAKKSGKRARLTGRSAKNKYMETVNNIFGYIDYVDNSHILQESHVNYDENGELVSVKVPTSRMKNEAKLLSLKWDTLKTDVKVIREAALRLSEDHGFCKAIAELKRHNNMSDDNSLTETLNSLVVNWPAVLYLTQEELSSTIADALETVGEMNYDDQTCSFMAEAIGRVAHDIHDDRVKRISSLAKVEIPKDSEDPFVEFQDSIKGFYDYIDESLATENAILEDLRDIVIDIRHAATRQEDDLTKSEAVEYLEAIDSVLSGEDEFNLTLAEEVAGWVSFLIETNLETSDWNVTKTPYRTTVGEHPDMAKKASHPYSPSRDFSGDWGAELPAVSDDGGSYKGGSGAKSMKSSWATKYSGGPDTYPSLNNPYVPKPYGDYKIKGEKHVDKDDSTGTWQSNDTWPNLQNPYVPSAVKVHTNNDNRVDDVESRVGMAKTSDLDQKIR